MRETRKQVKSLNISSIFQSVAIAMTQQNVSRGCDTSYRNQLGNKNNWLRISKVLPLNDLLPRNQYTSDLARLTMTAGHSTSLPVLYV